MRKKMGCLLALMALLSALTACGGDSAEDVSGTLPPETPMTPEETEFQSGRVEGGTYTNEFLSVACQLGDEWTYLTDEEIAQLNGEIGESLTDEELSEMFSNGKTVQDMYAASADGTATINVIFEDMGVLYGAALDEDAYINLVMPTLEDALMQAGMNANKSEDALAGSYGMFFLSCAFWLAAMFLLAWGLLRKRDVKA